MSGTLTDGINNVTAPWLTYSTLIRTALNPGDLIEVPRGTYSHWVMYHRNDWFGNYWCYHVTKVNGVARIMYESLYYILGRNGKAMCRVNNQESNAQMKNVNVRDSLQKVFDELASCANQCQIVHYTVNEFNCEYYSTKWRYGVGWTMQPFSTSIAIGTFDAAIAGIGAGILVVGHLISAVLNKGHDNKNDSN